MTKKETRSEDEKHNAVVTDSELENGEHPIGRLVHISTVTHAWRGVLEGVTPSYYVLSSEHPISLVDSTGKIAPYVKTKKAGSDGDEFSGGGTMRILRGACSWMLSW